MNQTIQNIYCVGRNYGLHAAELGNPIPDEPLIFTKPSHAWIPMEGQTAVWPLHLGELHYEAEMVLYIGKPYVPGSRVDDLVTQVTLGIDFTLRDVQAKLKKKGLPWLPAKGFRQSAALGRWNKFPGNEAVKKDPYTLRINGQEVQCGHLDDMIFNFQTLIDTIGQQYGLGEGDIIFTGTPEGVGPVHDGDHLELLWAGESYGAIRVQLGM